MGHMNDMIEDFADDFGKDALALVFPNDQEKVAEFEFSPKEWFRFRLAFYRTELFFVLFHSYEGLAEAEAFIGSESKLFFCRYPPPEKDQIACVHDVLKRDSLKVSHPSTYPVELGIDYLTLGPFNY
ncbi:hypothetical protein ACJ41O_013154 [Fusarium nematophilum]